MKRLTIDLADRPLHEAAGIVGKIVSRRTP